MSKTILAPELRSLIGGLLTANGSSATEAATVAYNLVLANLSGHDSHGVGMVPRYVKSIAAGELVLNTAAVSHHLNVSKIGRAHV